MAQAKINFGGIIPFSTLYFLDAVILSGSEPFMRSHAIEAITPAKKRFKVEGQNGKRFS
ncbi:MAG: hypothetical protein ACXQTR_03475 [Candidatus Methanospirareceae archaeon]